LYRGESAIRVPSHEVILCQKIARNGYGGCLLPEGLVSLKFKGTAILLTSLFESSELSED
jgi:hypothetical protein